MSMLEVRGLRAGYGGIPVIFGIDLDVDEGEVIAILGANGAGKTTALRAISGVISPMAGEVRFRDRRVSGRAADAIARAGMVHVPEGRGLFRSLGVDESLRLAAAMAGVNGQLAGRLREIYELFPRLADRRSQAAATLSGGEQQMLALARAIIVRPHLLLIDEMSQGLAPTVVAGLFDLVARLPEQGTAVVLVEQFVSRALALASRAYVLEKGQVRYAGDAKTLAADADFVRSSYLGEAAPTPEPETARDALGKPTSRRRERSARPKSGAEVTLTLPPALMRSLSEQAEQEGVPVGDLVARALRTRTPAASADAPSGGKAS